MLKRFFLLFAMCSVTFFSFAQKFSFSDLKKILSLNKIQRDTFLSANNYKQIKTQTDGDNVAISYRSSLLQNDKEIIRWVLVTSSKKIKITALQYTTYDEQECKDLILWLTTNGYKKNKTLSNNDMIFLESKTGLIRYFEDPADAVIGKAGTFEITK